MAIESFYGGKQGFSFIISKSFSSINEMVSFFSKGTSYTEVKFNEYAIINAVNKADQDNGKIYRRGYDFSNNLGGAVYIGTMVGSPGSAPLLQLSTVEEVESHPKSKETVYKKNTGSYNLTNGGLVPGKNGSTYNDEISWVSCSVLDKNAELADAYIGFKLPYLVVDYTAESADAYTKPTITRTDDQAHPFYEKWNIKIPKGIKGDALKNLRVMVADNTIQDYTGREDDINNKRKVLVYDYYDYTSSGSPTKKITYLGDYNIIKNVTLADNGTLTFSYEHENDKAFSKKIKWINTISVNASTGDLTVKYNNGTSSVLKNALNSIKSTAIDSDTKNLVITYTNGSTETINDPINSISEVAIRSSNYHLLIRYSSSVKRQEYIDAGTAVTYNNKEGWVDLGAIKSYNGILIGKNFNISDYPTMETIAGAVSYLNTNYASGLTGADLEGKVVSVGEANGEKVFYAYDYSIKSWFYLGKIEASSGSSSGGDLGVQIHSFKTKSEFDAMTTNDFNELAVGSMIFVKDDNNTDCILGVSYIAIDNITGNKKASAINYLSPDLEHIFNSSGENLKNLLVPINHAHPTTKYGTATNLRYGHTILSTNYNAVKKTDLSSEIRNYGSLAAVTAWEMYDTLRAGDVYADDNLWNECDKVAGLNNKGDITEDNSYITNKKSLPISGASKIIIQIWKPLGSSEISDGKVTKLWFVKTQESGGAISNSFEEVELKDLNNKAIVIKDSTDSYSRYEIKIPTSTIPYTGVFVNLPILSASNARIKIEVGDAPTPYRESKLDRNREMVDYLFPVGSIYTHTRGCQTPQQLFYNTEWELYPDGSINDTELINETDYRAWKRIS